MMVVFNNCFFRRYYIKCQPFSLNKYEKEKRVIELHLAGKTIREIAKELRMSFTSISKIIKAYERKKELQVKREESNHSMINRKNLQEVLRLLSYFVMAKNLLMLRLN